MNQTSAVLCAILLPWAAQSPAMAQDCCDPKDPYVLGEGFPETPATCETVGAWVDRALAYDGRISLAVTGALTEMQWDGALARPLMGGSEGVQVMCVSYYTNDRAAGDVVLMAGGSNRVGERQIVLDPCLTWDAE